MDKYIKSVTSTGKYSACVILPKEFIIELGIDIGGLVSVSMDDNEITIKKWDGKKEKK